MSIKTKKKSLKNKTIKSKTKKLLKISIKNDNERLVNNLEIKAHEGYYKSFGEIVEYRIFSRYINNELNSNDVLFEKKLLNNYQKLLQQIFFQYRIVINIKVSPFSIIFINTFIENYYKEKKNGSICVLSNLYSPLIPFLSYDININMIGRLKKNKILLFRNDLFTRTSSVYPNVKLLMNTIKRNINIEGDYEYDIENYLNDYISNNKSYKKKYDDSLIIISFYMEFFGTKIHYYILTALFNLKKGGNLYIFTSLIHHISHIYDFFVLLTTIFTDYKIIKPDSNDFLLEYNYLYEFHNYQELSDEKLIELANILLKLKKNEPLNLKNFLPFDKENINNGERLLTNIINESNKYSIFMYNNISYFAKEPLNYMKMYSKFILCSMFILFNNIKKILNVIISEEHLKLIYNTITLYYKTICCINDYYKNLTIKLFRNKYDINLELKYLQTNKKPYTYDMIFYLSYNIDTQKKITKLSVNKPLPISQSLFINNDIDKQLLVATIIDYFENLPFNTPKIINNFTFIEHWELLNEFNVINDIKKNKNKENSNILNHLHFGQNDSQFMSSVRYFIDMKYKNDIILKSYFDNFNVDRKNKIFNVLNIKYDLITCDDILDLEINGSKIWNIDSYFKDDAINNSFTILDKKVNELFTESIKDFEKYEFNKLYRILTLLEKGGSCYVKHVAFPLNSYLIAYGHSDCSGFFINYLYLYFQMFNKVILYKPVTIPNKSLEFYIVGIDFIGYQNIINDKETKYDFEKKILSILNNFKLHQTIFEKEDISELFINQINSFLSIITNRFIKFEEIKSMLHFYLNNKNSNGSIIENNEIVDTFLNKKLLNNFLTNNIYDNWKTKYIDIIKQYKLYYFSKLNEQNDNTQNSNSSNTVNFDFNILKKILDNNNFIQINNKNDIIDVPNQESFLHFYLPRKNLVIPENTTLVNLLKINNIFYKDKLYQFCLEKNETLTNTYIAESLHIDNIYNNDTIKNISKDLDLHSITYYIKLYIENGYHKSFMIKKTNELINLLNIIKSQTDKKNLTNYSLVLNKHFTEPLLFKNNIFHLRIFFIPFINNHNIIKTYISKFGLMFFIKDNNIIKNNTFNINEKKTDNYFNNNDIDYLFPNEFKNEYGNIKTNKVFDQIINIFQFISKIQKQNINKYPEAKHGYAILAADFIIDTNFNVKLLELNDNIELYSNSINNNNFLSEYLLTNIYNEIISDVFDLKKNDISENFILL